MGKGKMEEKEGTNEEGKGERKTQNDNKNNKITETKQNTGM